LLFLTLLLLLLDLGSSLLHFGGHAIRPLASAAQQDYREEETHSAVEVGSIRHFVEKVGLGVRKAQETFSF